MESTSGMRRRRGGLRGEVGGRADMFVVWWISRRRKEREGDGTKSTDRKGCRAREEQEVHVLYMHNIATP